MDDKQQPRQQLAASDDSGSSRAAGSGTTLRRPMQIVKKRSGPLEDALAELNCSEPSSTSSKTSSLTSQPTATMKKTRTTTCINTSPAPVQIQSFGRGSLAHAPTSPTPMRRKSTIKEKKEKKRERWLLTRKTWKYMTDAGRKLIPEGAQNRSEDIPKIERHFHQICNSEPRFLLWRRKSSYPGATRNSKRRLKQLLSHTGQKTPQSIDAIEQEEANNADQIIDLLQSYLKLDEARKTTTLLGSKTIRPDQTASPSAKRPGAAGSIVSRQSNTAGNAMTSGFSSRGPGFLPPTQPKGLQTLSEIEQLVERLRALSRSSTSCRAMVMPHERITPDILEDKTLLKQIYNELKKQQLHRILGRHAAHQRPQLPHSTSLSSLWHFGSSGKQHQDARQSGAAPTLTTTVMKTISTSEATSTGATSSARSSNNRPTHSDAHTVQRQRKPPSTLNLTPFSSRPTNQQQIPVIFIKKPSVEKSYNSCGTQTSFIQLQEIKRLAEEYKELKRQQVASLQSSVLTDDESDKATGAATGHHYRRKSSIDNEDVSQSVSDTIKRYLRMARKKSVHDENANRFKRVNYDQNLRNIRAKGEINPPGMDEGNNKAIQTLDAWPVITLDFIRGNENTSALAEAHAEWQKTLEERIDKKREYEEKICIRESERDSHMGTTAAATGTGCLMAQQKEIHSSCSSSSAPTSPTMEENFTATTPQMGHGSSGGASGLLHSSTQFLSNLWHGAAGGHHQQPNLLSSNSNSSLSSTLTNASTIALDQKNAAMQKSKSSSNVGQFVSKKLLKSRSKSQTRPTSSLLPKWTPAEKFTWTSDNDGRIKITDVSLHELSEIEAKILQRVAIEKINELNIGVSVTVPGEVEGKSSLKRRALSKKKAMTTSFFDIGKKDDKSNNFSVFGNTLENCVANDKKRRTNLVSASSDRGSRNSIASLFRSSSSKVRSCESLLSTTIPAPNLSTYTGGGGDVGVAGGCIAGDNSKSNIPAEYSNVSPSLPMSRSQSDVRRSSQDCDSELLQLTRVPNNNEDRSSEQQVPAFIIACIRHLEEYGLHLVGLFRVSTSKKRVRQLREEFDRNATSATNINADTCPHDVATLLKEFLRDLPEPLLCRSLYKAFLETQRIRNRRLQLEAISHLVKLLPSAHRDTLYVLLKFLAHVASCSDDVCHTDGSVLISGNKMDSNNLATVFAPNILRGALTNVGVQASAGDSNASSEQESMADAINVIRTMIDHFEEIFRVPAELIDAVYTHMFDVCPQHLNYLCEQRNLYDTDDIDSASSTTPINSPPPTISAYSSSTSSTGAGRMEMFGNDFMEDAKKLDQTGLQQSSPKVKAGATVAPVAPARKIYTREAVMHENSASKGGNVNGTKNNTSSRSRRLKPKYSDSESSVHRLMLGSSSSGDLSASGSRSSHSRITEQSQQQLQQKHLKEEQNQQYVTSASSGLRRQSSPYLLNKTGVVTASLQIPVQMPASPSGAAIASAYDDLDDVFYSHTSIEQPDFSDIPYIEDASSPGYELESLCEGFPITGSLSFAGKNKASAATAPQRVTTTSAVDATSKQKAQQQQKTSLLATMRLKSTPTTTTSAGSKNGNSNNNSASRIATLEPKLPTSISNIGGAILRSKTADFERMSTASVGKVSGNLPESSAATSEAQQPQAERRVSQTPLYKRQTIISSAKRTTPNK